MKCIHKTSIQKHTLSNRALLHQFLKLSKTRDNKSNIIEIQNESHCVFACSLSAQKTRCLTIVTYFQYL